MLYDKNLISSVGKGPRQARPVRNEEARSTRLALHEFDLRGGQAVKLIDQRVYLLVGGGDGVLERGLFRIRRGRTQLGHQSQQLVHQHHQLVVTGFVGGLGKVRRENWNSSEFVNLYLREGTFLLFERQ